MLQHPATFVNVDSETILAAYEISAEKNHDVYDCFYVALARETEADRIVTTDRDFERLCEAESFEYVNTVPQEVLERFSEVNG